MRIGLLIYGSLETLTGGYFYDRQVVQAWQAAGDTVEIVSLPWRGYAHHLGDNWSAALRQKLRQLPVDVLIQDQLCHPSVVWLNRRLRLPYPRLALIHLLKQTEQHPAGLATLYRLVENDYLRHVDGFIYNSEDSRRLVEARLRHERPGLVAYPGRDHLPARPPRQTPTDELNIISVGNILRRKGQHLLLEAVAQLRDLPWRVTFVGSGEFEPDYAAHCQRLIRKHGLAQRVAWLGQMPNEEIGPLLAASQLFVLPSSYEGFGIVYLEAQLAGLPVIATTAGAAGEIVADGQTGFLIPPDNIPALVACLRQLLTDAVCRRRLSEAARLRALSFPTWSETALSIRHFAHQVSEAYHD